MQGPFWVMGVAAMAAGALCTALPETLGAPQPDTLKDVDRNSTRPEALIGYQVCEVRGSCCQCAQRHRLGILYLSDRIFHKQAPESDEGHSAGCKLRSTAVNRNLTWPEAPSGIKIKPWNSK